MFSQIHKQGKKSKNKAGCRAVLRTLPNIYDGEMYQNGLIKKMRSISNFMASQPG